MTPCTCHPGTTCTSAASCAAARRVEFGETVTTTPAMPELPRETVIAIGKKHFPKTTLSNAWFGFAADIALATLQAQPAADWRDRLTVNLMRRGAGLTKTQIRALIAYAHDGIEPDPALFAQPAEVSDADVWELWLRVCAESDNLSTRVMIANFARALRPQAEQAQPRTFDARNAQFREENWQIRFDAAVDARRAAQEQLYTERERHTAEVKRLQAEIGRLKSERPQAVPMTDEPQWIVNDLGELGVKVGPRFFFLYKGDNIEYGTDGIGDSRDGVALHDDGTPMHYRIVGKREFGETCRPLQWVVRGHSESRYTEPLTFIPGLSWGKPEDGEWKPLPSRGITAPAGGEG